MSSHQRHLCHLCHLCLLCLLACESSSKGTQPAGPRGEVSFNTLLVRPDSTVILVQKPSKVVAMLDSQQMSWSVNLSGKIVTTPVVANDSSLYVLTTKKIYRLGNDGKIQFQQPLAVHGPRGKDPGGLFLTAMSDSSVVVSNEWGKCIKVSISGEQLWQYTLPEETKLTDPPISGANGALYLRTKRWLYSVNAQGRVRWRIQAGQGAFR